MDPVTLGMAKADAKRTFVPLSSALESVPFTVYGDSYGQGTQGASQESRPFNRLAVRHRTKTPVINAVMGTRMDQIATKVKDTWTPNSVGIVGFSDGVINDILQYGDLTGLATSRESFRSALAYLTSRAISGIGSSAFGFDNNWLSGVSSTADAAFNIAFSGSSAHLLVQFVTGSGGTLEVRNSSNVLVKTITTGGYKQAFVGATKLTGGTGTNKFSVKLTTGTATIVGIAVPSATPPLIVWDKPGQYRSNTAERDRLAAYLAECATVLSDFPTVLSVDAGSGWDYPTMISIDTIHRNDRGNRYIADRIDTAVRAYVAAGEVQGLNRVTQDGADAAYTTPVADTLVTVYVSDGFDRANAASLGTTEIGGMTWVDAGGTFGITGGKAAATAVTLAGAGAYSRVDSGHADGTLRMTVTAAGQGIAARCPGDTTGYILWRDSTKFMLSKRTASASYTPLITSSGVTPTGSDVLELVMSGSSFTAKVNGVSIGSTTDASYTSNMHGMFTQAVTNAFDDFRFAA